METKNTSLVTISLDQLEYYLNRIKKLESQLRSCEYDLCECGEMFFAPDGFDAPGVQEIGGNGYCSSRCAEKASQDARSIAMSDELDYQFAKSGR